MVEKRSFDKAQSYEDQLKLMRKEFLQLWDQRKPSPSTGLDDFEVSVTLGQGAYGLVVSLEIHCSQQNVNHILLL